ncbi:MAG: radical SAM protein [Polyangiaceae bacterium]|nr:radical SAM protein [Polyangiaceae bacterium]
MDVALVLTRACNLSCGYCFAGDKVKARMTPEVASAAIDLALDRADAAGERLELSFFGGEPLLEWDLLIELAAEARARADTRGMKIALQVTTNGTLLDAGRVSTLADLGVHVALSHDGTAWAHDTNRRTRGDRGTHAEVEAALDLLLACGRPFDVITVVDPATLGDLASGVRALLDRGVERLTLNPSWAAAWSPERLEALRGAYEQIAAYVIGWFRRGRTVSVQPLDSALVLAARGERRSPHLCTAGVKRLAIAPSGRIYGCGRSVREDDGTLSIGSLEAGLDAARPAICPEGCACASFEETGDAATPGPVQRLHDALVAELAPRIIRALESEAVGRATFERTFRNGTGGAPVTSSVDRPIMPG